MESTRENNLHIVLPQPAGWRNMGEKEGDREETKLLFHLTILITCRLTELIGKNKTQNNIIQ